MLKISEGTLADETTVLRLEGRVIGPWVTEVRKSCDHVLARGSVLTVDLAEVSFLDRDGIVLFQDLKGRQIRLINGSPFVTEQLKEVSR